jgi:hypothetical protein
VTTLQVSPLRLASHPTEVPWVAPDTTDAPVIVGRPRQRRQLVGIVACVGVIIGTVGASGSAGLNGIQFGLAAMVLGAVSGAILGALSFWTTAPLHPKWFVPLTLGATVAGWACLAIAAINIASAVWLPTGTPPNWGLWLLAASSVLLTFATSVAATALGTAHPDGKDSPWVVAWMWVATTLAVTVIVSGAFHIAHTVIPLAGP